MYMEVDGFLTKPMCSTFRTQSVPEADDHWYDDIVQMLILITVELT